MRRCTKIWTLSLAPVAVALLVCVSIAVAEPRTWMVGDKVGNKTIQIYSMEEKSATEINRDLAAASKMKLTEADMAILLKKKFLKKGGAMFLLVKVKPSPLEADTLVKPVALQKRGAAKVTKKGLR